LVLPPEVFEVLRDVVAAMASGQAVTIAPVHQRLTTQEAADLLGISRPTLVKLLDGGEIPYEQPGRHRRVRLADVLAYQQHRSAQRREALDEMVEIADQSGMYEQTATPIRTR
jgi:excisionase family DNA binding protein